MGKPLEQLIPRNSGELIRSDDWNDLVTNIQALQAKLSDHIQDTDERVGALEDALKALTKEFKDYKTETEPVISQFYRVSVQTTKATFAIGELALLEVKVNDPRGGAVRKEEDSGQPWVDFVTTWGQLIPSPGFVSVAGEGDRSISVQANAQGIARALLKSDHAVGFSKADDDAIAISLATKPQGSNKAIAELIAEAATPLQAKNDGAFKVLSQEYQRKDTATMRNYADSYYLKYAPQVSGRVFPQRTTWRDYRATVMVFAKSDNDPTSPDMRRGADSILVTFRDWISPWITLEYMDTVSLAPMIQSTRTVFQSKVTKNYRDTNLFIRGQVDEMVREEGLLGKIRQYKVIDDALDGLTVNDPPDFLPGLAQAMQQGVRVQQTLENAQSAALAVSSEATAFQAITDSITRADSDVSGFNTRLNGLQTKVSQVDGQVSNLQNSLGVVSGKVDAALTEGGVVGNLRAEVNTMKAQFLTFQDIDPTKVRNTQTDVRGISDNLLVFEKRLKSLEGKQK